MTLRRRGTTVLVALLLLVTGCSQDSGETITVFAAASLQRAFTAEARAFEQAHPGTTVRLSFAGSQSLVAQVRQGAPADVLATADLATLASVRDELRDDPRVFAHNALAIVTAPGNPLHLTSLQDLRRVRVVLAGPAVPAGKAAAAALATAHVTLRPVSLEDSAGGVVTKVRLGEAEAGIAYATDLLTSGVGGAPLAGTETALAIGAVTSGGGPFVSFVLSDEGRKILTSHGFR